MPAPSLVSAKLPMALNKEHADFMITRQTFSNKLG
jgi:hypothetical protein